MSTLTTPKLGFPYPDGAERVMDGDNAIGALALAVENILHPALRDMVPAYRRSTGQLTLTTTDTLIPGMSYTYTPPSQETVLLIASYDLEVTTAGVGVCNGTFYVDGTTRGSGAAFGPATTGRETVINFALAGLNSTSHTIECRARKTINAGAAVAQVAGVSLGAQSSTFMITVRFKDQPALRELLEGMGGGEALPAALGLE